MKILITGGTGLIGTQLTAHLINQHSVIVLSRNVVAASRKLGGEVQVVDDLTAVDFNQVNAIINLAGEPIIDHRWTPQQKTKLEQSRWRITQQLVDGINAADTPPHTFISGSATGYYGRQGSNPIDERYQDSYPEYGHALCERWEQIALGAESAATRVCLIRTGIVLAKHGGALAKMLPAFKLGLGGPISTGQQMMSWIHLDDMVQLLLFVLTHSQIKGAVNATAPNPVSNAEFSRVLANRLHRPHFFRVPRLVLKWLLGERSDLILYGQNVIPQKLLQAGYKFRYSDIDKALHDLV